VCAGYKEAYVQETLAFVDCLVKDKLSPCSGEDGLIALILAIAADISAEEGRWVRFSRTRGGGAAARRKQSQLGVECLKQPSAPR
jgi:hypothetical protein